MITLTKHWFFCIIGLPGLGWSQQALTIRDAVEQAVARYPSIAVSESQVEAAAAGIKLARTAYAPRIDTLAQFNRATRNNVYGMLLQQPVISPISGPPVAENSASSIWGSAVGVLVTWEPFDFGLRKSQVDLATARRSLAGAAAARTRFEVGAAVADAFLTVLAAQETVKAAQAGTTRAEVLLRVVEALVRAELRPGLDAVQTQAENAAAQGQLVRAEQAVAQARAVLAGLLGVDPAQLAIVPGRLLEMPAVSPSSGADLSQNPAARQQTAAVEEAMARSRTLDRQWVPRFGLQATTYARGTGARPDFTTLGGAHGLAPNFYNWGLGLTVMFPLMDYAAVRARQAGEQALVRAEQGRSEQLLVELATRRNEALAALHAANKLAALAPVQLEAARAAETQAGARYKAGLTTILDVADAQRRLTQAEIDHGLARLNVWRALLAVAAAEGDLAPLLISAM